MAWKNISIQGKFFIGFSFIIVLLIFLSIISIYNIQQIISNADQVIEGNKLKSSIIQKEVDHLNWISHLSNFLNNDDITELSIETDPTKCAFGIWYYGKGRTSAENLVPQLHTVLNEIEPYHTALHESAASITEHYSSVDLSLGSFFQKYKNNHLNWLIVLFNYIIDPQITTINIELDSEQCDLGKWLHSDDIDTLVSEYPELLSKLENMLIVHGELHESAGIIAEMVSQGQDSDALNYFRTVTEVKADLTLTYLDEIISWYDAEIEHMAISRDIFSNETIIALRGVQNKFDEIISITNNNIMTEDVMLESGKSASMTLLIISIVTAVLAIVVAFILATTIIKPIIKCVSFAEQIGIGDLSASLDIDQKDQIGQLCDSLRNVLRGFKEKALVIEKIAEGDLTAEIKTLSDKDGLGISLLAMKRDLNILIGRISVAVTQISSGSEQIAEASQSLSEGATTQASSTEEVSVMVNEISGQAAQNSDNASQARAISEKASLDAEKGNTNMGDVVVIMEKINRGADDTKKIVKVIDDIAFQINLLALNANVEAARAGKYGKGFAVVADEVRNLAVKSAQAAKETSEKVEESIKNIRNGSNAVQVSADQLKEIVKGSQQVSEILGEIASANKNQDDGISQATTGLDLIDKITQENTGNAEEAASASEELSSQSQELKGLVDRFKLEGNSRRKVQVNSIEHKQNRLKVSPVMRKTVDIKPINNRKIVSEKNSFSTGIKPVNPSEIISLDDNDFDQF